MAEQKLPKLTTRVRFPSPAPGVLAAAARSAARGALLLLALLPALCFAQAAANPRLASLAIEIWPEYDRPAVLVILRAVIAEDVMLPAQVSLRLPAAAGRPAAVAHSASADGNLLNLGYDQSSSGAYSIVKFQAPERFFHVEFYEPLTAGDSARSFSYTWPGDFAVDRATLVVQEPAGAQGLVTEPALTETSTGAAGLNYRAGDLGALVAGKAITFTIKYTKPDARPSVDIKGMRVAQAAPANSAVPAAADARREVPAWALPMAALGTLAAAGALLVVVMWRRTRVPRPAVFCARCMSRLRPDDNYCGKCGTKVTARRRQTATAT